MNRLIGLIGIFALSSCSSGNKTHYASVDGVLTLISYTGNELVSEIQLDRDSLTKQGLATYYYKNGKKRKTAFFDYNYLSGSYTEFDSNGNISLYMCYDGAGHTVFKRIYNSNGKLESESGDILPIVELYDDRTEDGLEKKFMSFIVNPPHTYIKVSNYCTYNKDMDTLYPYKERIGYDWAHYYYFKLPKHGLYKYNQTTMIIDSTNKIGLRVRDTIETVL